MGTRTTPVTVNEEGKELHLYHDDRLVYGGGNPDPFAETSGQEFPLGTKLVYNDRVFKYTKNGAVAITAGKMMQVTDAVSGHEDMVTAAAAAGATSVTVTPTSTDTTLDQYQDGYLWANDLTGEGQLFRVKSNPVIVADATGVIVLYDAVVTALASDTKSSLIASPFNGNLIQDLNDLRMSTGASPIDVTASYYFWQQVAGPAAILTDGTILVGQHVRQSDGADGAVEALNRDGSVEDEQELGVVILVNATSDYSLIKLTCE
jgi:hypothetical protein